MIKAMYINDYQCNFIDNQGKIIFSFKSCNRITFLDIRKLQLASMIKGAWCKYEEITYYLSFLHQLDTYAIGKIVNYFALFDFDLEKSINHLPNDIWEIIATIANGSNFSSFFIYGFEDGILELSVKEFFPTSFWSIFDREEIDFIGDLLAFSRADLLAFRGVGVKKTYDIEKLLAEKGLHLKEEKKDKSVF